MKRTWTMLLAAVWLTVLAGCVTEEQTRITPAKHGERKTTLGKAIDKAEDAPCDLYLGQLQQAVVMYRQDHEDQNPPDIEAVIKASGLPKSELVNCKYTYDPATGKVGLAR
jgi:hypothetical protein